jgi:hypothetical protein
MNNPGVLFDNGFPEEIRQAGISRSQYIEAWKAVDVPRLARFKVIGNIEVQKLSAHRASASQRLRSLDGRDTQWSFVCEASEDGPRIEALSVIPKAWHLEYLVEKGLPSTKENVSAALLAGIKSDRQVLEQIGLKGLPSRTSGGYKLRTWDEMERLLTAK